MTYLLDVNVLIALIDGGHTHHHVAHGWFDREGRHAFATCPITENGVLRIVGNPRYAGSPGSPAEVIPSLAVLRGSPGHEFWSDDLSLLDSTHIKAPALLNASQVTDSYLLALAVSRGGRFATLDRRLIASAVLGGADALCIIAGA